LAILPTKDVMLQRLTHRRLQEFAQGLEQHESSLSHVSVSMDLVTDDLGDAGDDADPIARPEKGRRIQRAEELELQYRFWLKAPARSDLWDRLGMQGRFETEGDREGKIRLVVRSAICEHRKPADFGNGGIEPMRLQMVHDALLRVDLQNSQLD
jgi:hypothetical protein